MPVLARRAAVDAQGPRQARAAPAPPAEEAPAPAPTPKPPRPPRAPRPVPTPSARSAALKDAPAAAPKFREKETRPRRGSKDDEEKPSTTVRKKKERKPPAETPCRFWVQGDCRRAEECPYLHDPAIKAGPPTPSARAQAMKGGTGCVAQSPEVEEEGETSCFSREIVAAGPTPGGDGGQARAGGRGEAQRSGDDS